jgi:hypothetical protein
MFGAIGGIVSGIAGIIGAQQLAKEREKVRKLIEQWGREGIGTGFRGLDAQYDSLEALIQNAFDQEQFSRAARVDPYGNRLYYNKENNTWEYDLSPMQQQLFTASQDEQLRQLSQDAPLARAMRALQFRQNRDVMDFNRTAMQESQRNQSWNTAINNFMRQQMRAGQEQQAENRRRVRLNENVENSVKQSLAENRQISELNRDVRGVNRISLENTEDVFRDNEDILRANRQTARGNERIRGRLEDVGDTASQDYRTALTDYKYRQPESEGAIRDDITRLIAQAMGGGDRLMRDYANRDINRRAGNVPIVVGGAGGLPQESFGPQIAQTMMQARQQALGESQGRRAEHENKYASILQRLTAQMGLGAGQQRGMGAPSPTVAPYQMTQTPYAPIGRGQVQTNNFGTLGQNPLLQPGQVPGGQDATGAVASNLNALETNMANAIANAMGVEANALNSGYGRIGQSYQNLTNNYGNMIRGIASTMPSGQGGAGGMAGGIGSIFKGLGGLFGGGMGG